MIMRSCTAVAIGAERDGRMGHDRNSLFVLAVVATVLYDLPDRRNCSKAVAKPEQVVIHLSGLCLSPRQPDLRRSSADEGRFRTATRSPFAIMSARGGIRTLTPCGTGS
jgi:hypothetical protein